MNKKTTTRLGFAHILALLLPLAPPARAVERQTLSGHVPKAVASLQPMGQMPGSTRLSLTISLPLRNQEALTMLLEQIYDPANPQYRHYLTAEQFAERFAPTKQDYETLVAFAKSQGLSVTATHPNRTLLDVSGSVGDIEKAFHVTLHVYQHPTEARTFHAPDSEPSLDLAVPVLRIGGLDNFHLPRSLAHKMGGDSGRRPRPLAGSAPGGSFLGNDFRAAYVPGVALTGAGQSVALIEFDGYYASDITDYESLTGITNVPLSNVLLDGFDGTPAGGNFEVALDIEMAIAMAPGLAQVVVYEGYTDADILNRIATDDTAKQISSSWVLGFNATTDQIFQQYAAQGQSFFQASGDDGAYPGGWVADDPYITVVGGTELSTSGPGGSWTSERAWNQGFVAIDGAFDSSGGGISTTYIIPTWQKGLSMTANQGSLVRRNSPDVCMVAENLWIRWNQGDASAAVGTSASAPLWAGFAALANQLAEATGQPPIGFINPAIYALGKGASYNSAFHDIVTGNNTNDSSPTKFSAVPGYDLCTGWGTPAGSNLLYALALPEALQITPSTNLAVAGAAGGPFIPSAQSYSLTNAGVATLEWAVASGVSWLDVSANGGTLAPSAPATTVTVSVNSDANHLPPGNYSANLWFTNVSGGSVQSRVVTVGVFSAPVLVSGPVSQTVPEGGTATFTVVAAGIGTVSYQWNRDGSFLNDDAHISGSKTATLTISNASVADSASYGVLVMNSIGVFSSGLASLTVVPSAPVIVVAPTNQTVLPGATVTFAVQAVGTPPLFYQWRTNGTDLSIGGNSNLLTLRNASPADAGLYSVIVSNSLGMVTNAGAILAVIPLTAPGVTLTTLHSFSGADGANPSCALVQGGDGRLYGTTSARGANANGTVFRFIPTNGVLSTLHSFTGGNDGAAPQSGLAPGRDGNFYGTTLYGGALGYGTVFRITPNGAFTTVHAFTEGTDGAYPYAGLISATDGNLYGVAEADTNGYGTVFKVATNGTLTVVHGFDSTDGSQPRGGLIQGNDGALYGTTHYGGTNNDGTAFRITTDGALTTLFEFKGIDPYPCRPSTALVQAHDGNFYGTSGVGGAYSHGSIFKLTTNGQVTVLHSFAGGPDGQWPLDGLIEGRDGYLYGTTSYGGTGFDGTQTGGQGTVFRMTTAGELTTLVYFVGSNGATPVSRHGGLMQASDGNFYGTTFGGGAYGDGTLFRLTVPEPTLSIEPSGNDLVLSWPSWASDLVLQQTSDLTAPNWTRVPKEAAVTNLQYRVVISPAPAGNNFYRLTH